MNELTDQQLNDPSDLLPLVASFADLSSGTEFSSYKEPQWRLLLSGGEICSFVMHSKKNNELESEDGACNPRFDGCVLRVHLKDGTIGFGMVLVRPAKRGTGIAKALLKKAMEVSDEGGNTRFVLAACSTLGQPLYRKLGFVDVGTVTAMACSVSDLMQDRTLRSDSDSSNGRLSVVDGKEITQNELNLLVNCDTHATGIERRDRIKIILDGYAEGSRSSVAFLRSGDCCSTAVARQDCTDGPLIIGPMRGKEECCIPLVRGLINNHFQNAAEGDTDSINMMMIVTGHPNLVTKLLEIKGMNKLWKCPSMSSDGRPVYENCDGSYLAIMHPTLG